MARPHEDALMEPVKGQYRATIVNTGAGVLAWKGPLGLMDSRCPRHPAAEPRKGGPSWAH